MQSSINVIKNSRVIDQGNREINTQLSKASRGSSFSGEKNSLDVGMESYENIASNMLENARRESEMIISKAYIDAAKAKIEGFIEGLENGNREGYATAYKDAIDGAMEAADAVRADADFILVQAKHQYSEYLVKKEKHIKALIVNIAENILKKEVKEMDALNEMIFSTIKTERNAKSYVIKANSTHFATIKDEIQNFKNRLAFQGDIFVIEDSFLDDGTAVIEKETGKSIVSIAYGIEKIIEVFQEEQIQL
jgi:flagellar assembly protein FliH